MNVQDSKLKNAYIELRSRDDEIRLLELQMQEEKREMALFRKKLPVKRALDQELELYRICVSVVVVFSSEVRIAFSLNHVKSV